MSKIYVCRLPDTEERGCIPGTPGPACAEGELPCAYLEAFRNPILRLLYSRALVDYRSKGIPISAFRFAWETLEIRHNDEALERHEEQIGEIFDRVMKLAKEAAHGRATAEES